MGFKDEDEFSVILLPQKPPDSPSLRYSNVITLFHSKQFESIPKEKQLQPISDLGILSKSFPAELLSSTDPHNFPKNFVHKPSLLELESRHSTMFRFFQPCPPTHNLALGDGSSFIATPLHDTTIHSLYIFQPHTISDINVKLVVEPQLNDEGFQNDVDFAISPKPPDQIVIPISSPFSSCFSKQFIQRCLGKEAREVIIVEIDNATVILFHHFDFCQNCSPSSTVWTELNFLVTVDSSMFPYANDTSSYCGLFLYLYRTYYAPRSICFPYHASSYGEDISVSTHCFGVWLKSDSIRDYLDAHGHSNVKMEGSEITKVAQRVGDDDLSLEKIFIVEATGSTGKRIVEQLLAKRFAVKVRVRDLDKAKTTLSSAIHDSEKLIGVCAAKTHNIGIITYFEVIKKVITNLRSSDIDPVLEELLIDGILYAFQEQPNYDANVMLNGFGAVVNSLGQREKPYLPQIRGTIKWRLNNKSAKVRHQTTYLISRIVVVMKQFHEEQLMGHLGVVLYEYLGEEYPEVLGSILGALKSIVNVIGMTKMTPPIKDLLLRLTSILKNRHEKVQENCIDLLGRIAYRGAEFVPAREWMRIYFELLEMLKANDKGIRRATVNTFEYIAKAIGPHDVLATLLNIFKFQERQNHVCIIVAIAIVAETCSPVIVLPTLMNEYRVPELNVQNGVLKSLSFLCEYTDKMGKDYIYVVTPLLEDALMDRDLVYRQTTLSAMKHMALGVAGLSWKDALDHVVTLHPIKFLLPNSKIQVDAASGENCRGEPYEDVIFLHGFMCSSSFWTQTVFPCFSENVNHNSRLIVVDLLGFGMSPKPRDCLYILNDRVEMNGKYVVQPLQIGSFRLAHSIGSVSALALAAKYSNCVKFITFVAPPYCSFEENDTCLKTFEKFAGKKLWPMLSTGSSFMPWYEHLGRTICLIYCRNHRQKFYNLEDKVVFEGVGNDRIMELILDN